MKKTILKAKLVLHKDTIRALSDPELAVVAAGADIVTRPEVGCPNGVSPDRLNKEK